VAEETVSQQREHGRAVIIIIGAIAELERDLIIERVRAGMRRARFPQGDVPLMPYSETKASQVSPFARRGIISSVLPCPCADPHGFSVDILSAGGSSGSPIVRADDRYPYRDPDMAAIFDPA
jgi:hypothetical protein